MPISSDHCAIHWYSRTIRSAVGRISPVKSGKGAGILDFSVWGFGPGETFDPWFDYVHDVESGETVTAATFTLEVAETATGETADASPASRLSGVASFENSAIGLAQTVAQQRITGCLAGNRYRLICLATTSNGQILEGFYRFWCRDPA